MKSLKNKSHNEKLFIPKEVILYTFTFAFNKIMQ